MAGVNVQGAIEELLVGRLDVWSSAIRRKSAAGRGSSGKFELYGIKKLRELILELAVRGLLVPQDPNDEPASVLLKKIAAEKARLVKEGKIKKDKPLPPIKDEEKPFSLPSGWQWCWLADLAFSQAGFAFKSNGFNESGDGLPLIRIRDVGQQFSGTYFYGEFRPEFLVNEGDYLISMDGNFRVAPWRGRSALLNQRVSRLLFHSSSIKQRFVADSLQLRLLELQGVKAYTTVDHLSGGQISASVIALPPFAEQHRIVARVDELMTLCDQLEQQTEASINAHQTLVETLLWSLTSAASHEQFSNVWQRIAAHFDTLFTTEDSIDQLKQTILQLAIMGKLVPQDPNDESASVLLKKIAAQKARLVKDGKIKKDKPLPSIKDEEKPFEVPEGWEWVRFGEVTNSRLGKMLDNAKNKGAALPYLRNTNVQWHRFDLSDIKLMRIEDEEKEEFILKGGDLLICEGGEPGRCAIWRNQAEEMYFQKALHRARPYNGVLPEYLQYCLNVDASSGLLEKYFTGATIKHFVGAKLNQYVISLPPALEQHRIVTKIDELMALCDQLKTRLNAAQITQVQLADAVAAGVLV